MRRRVTLDQDREAPFAKGVGLSESVSQNGQWDWGYVLRMRNADDTADIELLKVNEAGQVIVGGVPVQGVGASQTPWVSNINGAGFALINTGDVGVGNNAEPPSTLFTPLYGCKSLVVGSTNPVEEDFAGFGAVTIAGAGYSTLAFADYRFPGAEKMTAAIECYIDGELGTSALWFTVSDGVDFIYAMNMMSSGNVGMGVDEPFYKLDILGDCNITGSYRVNGVPITAGGGAQSPWTSNIDAAAHSLNNVTSLLMHNTTEATDLPIMFYKAGGVRWGINVNYIASDFEIRRSNDAGVDVGVALGINRATGLVSLSNGLTVTGLTSLTGGANVTGNATITGNVNITGSYQVNGFPIGGQTPWTQNVNAAEFNLDNAGVVSSKVYSTRLQPSTNVSHRALMYLSANSFIIESMGHAGARLVLQTQDFIKFFTGFGINSERLRISTDGSFNFYTDAGTVSITGSVGIGKEGPAYKLDIVGDCNITGTYRVNGSPLAGGGAGLADPTTTLGDLIVRGASAITRLGVGTTGQVLCADSTQPLGMKWVAPGVIAQTPWASDQDAAGYGLTNIRGITFNDSAVSIKLWGTYSDSGSSPFMRMQNTHATGRPALEIYNNSFKNLRLGVFGDSWPFAPAGVASHCFLRFTNNLLFLNNNEEIKVTLGQTGNLMVTGNLGINTAPSYPLHVAGDATITGNAIISNGKIGIGTFAPSESLHVESAAPVVMRQSVVGVRGALHYFDGTSYFLLFTGASDPHGTPTGLRPIVVNGIDGRVGIGQASTAYQLSVAGDVDITGVYRVNGTPITGGVISQQTIYGTPARALDTVYRNTSGKPMMVSVTLSLQAASGSSYANAQVKTDSFNPPISVVAATLNTSTTTQHYETLTFWVLPNNYYMISQVQALVQTGNYWTEWT